MAMIKRYLMAAGLFMALLPQAQASSQSDIAKALANPSRSAADIARDARDKPQQVLAFAGFKKGMLIADVYGGGGYYSEILSGVVGKKGRVLLVNNAPYDAYAKKDLSERQALNRLPNVDYLLVPNEAMGLGRNRLDGALIIMSYHDLFYDDSENGWPEVGHEQFMDQIVAALKPGGRLLIVDHAAKAGSGSQDSKTLHRIDEQFTIASLRARGLEWVGSIPDLRNADDDHSKSVFDPAVKGKTDRFVHVYRKPDIRR